MNKLGLRCENVPGDTEVLLEDDDIEDHELLAAGRAWIPQVFGTTNRELTVDMTIASLW